MGKVKKKSQKISKITMSTALVTSSLSVVAPLASAATYGDIGKDHTHYEAIMELSQRGVIKGYEDNTFKPSNSVKRAHAAKIIAKALNLNTQNVKNPKFSDVKESSEYYPYIAALAEAKIIDGFNGKFNPNGHMTRGQMAKVIARAFSIESKDGQHPFTDVPKGHEYAPYIAALAEHKVTIGKSSDTFAMNDHVTRGQLSSFVVRAEKIHTSGSVSGTIDDVAKTQITIDGQAYAVSESVKFLLASKNEAALKDAEIEVTVNNGEIVAVSSLTIVEGKSFDGEGANIKKLVIGKAIETVKNITVEALTHTLPNANVSYENVAVETLNVNAGSNEVASLNHIVAIEQDAQLALKASTIGQLIFKGKSINVTKDDATKLTYLNAINSTQVQLNGKFGEVEVPANALVQGQGAIARLITQKAAGSILNVATGIQVSNVKVDGKEYSWQEALASKLVSSVNNSGENTEGSTSTPGGSTPSPGGNTSNPGGSTPTPGGDTSNPGGNTPTPGEKPEDKPVIDEIVFTEIPVVSDNNTITYEGQELKLDQAAVETIAALKEINKDADTKVNMTVAQGSQGELIVSEAVVETQADQAVLELSAIGADVAVTVVATKDVTIKGLQSTANVIVEAQGNVVFEDTKTLQNVTVENASAVSGLKAAKLNVENSKSIAFTNSEVDEAVVTNVEQVSGLKAVDVVLYASQEISMVNTTIENLTIEAKPLVAARSFFGIASLNARANYLAAGTDIVKVTLDGSTTENLTINREDVVVDTQNGATISKVNVNSNHATLASNEIGSIFVAENITTLVLGTPTKQANVKQLDLVLTTNMLVTGNAKIATLNIAQQVAGTKVTLDKQITVQTNNNPEFVEVSEVYTLAPTPSLGSYTIPNVPTTTKIYYVQHKSVVTPPANIDISKAQRYYPAYGLFVNSSTEMIALYNEAGELLSNGAGTITTSSSSRPIIKIVDVKPSVGVIEFKVTASTLEELASKIKHLTIYNHATVNGEGTIKEKVAEYNSFPSTFKITTSVNEAHTLTVPLQDISSINQLVVIAGNYIYDTIPNATKDNRINVLKDLAQKAKDRTDYEILRPYLTQTIGLEGKQYDSIFMASIIDKLLVKGNGEISTLDELTQFVEDTQNTKYNVIRKTSELLLGTGIKKVEGDGIASIVTVEGDNLLIETKADGTDIVKFTDAAGLASLLKVTVNTAGATDADKVKIELLKTEVASTTEVLAGDARLATAGSKTYAVPASTNKQSVLYTPAATTAMVGTVQVASVKGTADAAAYTADTLALAEVEKTALNLSGNIARQVKATSGYVETDDSLYFYSLATSGTEQYVIEANGQKTAVGLTHGVTLTTNIATKKLTADNLAIGQVKNIESTTTGTTMHTRKSADNVEIFASKLKDIATFKVTAQDDKVTLVNAKTPETGLITLDAVAVKEDVTVATGESIVTPLTATKNPKEDIVRVVGNTLYATGVGTQRIVLTDGKQLDAVVKQDANGYSLTLDEAISQVAITPADLDLQNISTVNIISGTSAEGINVGNKVASITAVKGQTGKTLFEVTDSDGKKARVYIDVADGVIQGTYNIVKADVTAADLGMTDVVSVSARTEIARAVVQTNTDPTLDVLAVYGTGIGYATFTVTGKDTTKALVNVQVKNGTNGEMEVEANVAKKDTGVPVLADDAKGNGIVRIEGNVLYALAEGTVDLPIKDNAKLFYRVEVKKDATTGHYSLEGTEIEKAVYSSTELGLNSITAATSSNTDAATVEHTSDRIILTKEAKDGTGRVTVTGPNGLSYVYFAKTDSGLTSKVEKSTTSIDVKTAGLSNISSNKTWSNTDLVRSVENGTNLDFYITLETGENNVAYTVQDDEGDKAIINLPITTNAAGHREITPEIVGEEVAYEGTAKTGAVIVDGTSIRLHTEPGKDGAADKQFAYAVGLGETTVRLADGKLVKYKVTTADGLYELKSEAITNGQIVKDTDLDLNGNLTISGLDTSIATAVVQGKEIVFTGLKEDAETSVLVSDGTNKVLASVKIVDGELTVAPIKLTAPADTTYTAIHAVNNTAWVKDSKAIYALASGDFYYVKTTGIAKEVRKATVTKTGTAYKIEDVGVVPSVIYAATELGLKNALEVQATYSDEVIYAGMVVEVDAIKPKYFVAYQKATGQTDVAVKDSSGQTTIVQFDSNTAETDPTKKLTAQIAKEDTPFVAADLGLDPTKDLTVKVKDLTVAEMHEDNKLYLLKQGTTYAEVTDGTNKTIVTIAVTKEANKLKPTLTPVAKTAEQLITGATTVTALPNNGTNKDIVRVKDGKVYAVGKGTTQVKIDSKIVNVIVEEEGASYSLTAGAVVNFIELPIGDGTYTVADVTNTSSAIISKDDNGTVDDKTDDKLIISVNGSAPNGFMDLLITAGGVSTVHHIEVKNGEITTPPKQAIVDLVTGVTGLNPVTTPNSKVQVNGAKLHLLEPGKAALKGTDGVANVTVTRDDVTKHLKATQKVVQQEIKEAITPGTDKFAVVTDDGKTYLRALDEQTEKVYYTDNYRVTASTVLTDEAYKLSVEERHMKQFDYKKFGLTEALTLKSDNEDLAKAEMKDINGDNVKELILYAGAGATAKSGTTTVTATDGNKQVKINVTRNEDGTISYETVGQADALTFADLNIDLTAGDVEVEVGNEAFVQATLTDSGISLAAQANGTTHMLVKQKQADDSVVVKAIVNIRVTDNKAIPEIVKYDGKDVTDVITGQANIVRKTTETDKHTLFAVAEGNILYANNDNKNATQLRITKNTESDMYSITPSSFVLSKIATTADLPIDSTTKVSFANSSVAEAYAANGALYVLGKSLGSTNVLITTGTDKAIVHAHVKDGSFETKVAGHTPTEVTGTFTGNDVMQVRNGKLFPLAEKTSTIQVKVGDVNTLVTAAVTTDIDTNEYKVKLTHVKHQFTGATTITAVGESNKVVKIAGDTIYAIEAGKVQVDVDGKLRDVEVVENADGTFKVVVAEERQQIILTEANLGLDLTNSSTVAKRVVTGADAVETQVLNDQLYVKALAAGEVELTVDGKTIVYVKVTAENNVFKLEKDIAKTELEATGTLAPVKANNPAIRVNDDTKEVYALAEGISLVEDKTNEALYKVSAKRENNVLKVENNIVEKTFKPGDDVTDIPANDVVRGTATGTLIAKATGMAQFTYDGTVYRVNVSDEGELAIEVLGTTTIDLSVAIAGIDGTPSSSLLTLSSITDAKMNVTANKQGTEIMQVKDTSGNTILVQVTVDANNTITYDIIDTEIPTSSLGFYPKSVTGISNGLVKITDSIVTVYPGPTTGKQYFKVTGDSGKQAIYSLNVTAVDLATQKVDYTVEPLHVDIPITALGVSPEIIAVDGTAKPALKTKAGVEVIEVVLNNTDPSYLIVTGENGKYHAIEVQATANGTTDYTTAYKVHGTLKLDAITKESLNGPVKAVTHGNHSVLYATGEGEISYENNGKLYNGEVTEAVGIYTISAGTVVTLDEELKNPRLVDGTQNIVLESGNTYAAAVTGEAIYATDEGYKKVVVSYNTTTKAYESAVTDVPSVKLPDTVVSAEMVKAPNTVKLDGTTVYGEELKTDKVIVVSTKDSDGRVTLYKETKVVNADVTTYEFKPLTSDVYAELKWDPSVAIEVTNNTASAVARVTDQKDQVFLTATGTTEITYKSATNITKTVKYVVDENYNVTVTVGKNVISYTRIDEEVNNNTQIKVTFDLNIQNLPEGSNTFVTGSISDTSGVVSTGQNFLRLTFVQGQKIDTTFVLRLREYIGAKNYLEADINKLKELNVKADSSTASPTLEFISDEFEFIKKTN